ncbi:MAG: hypothetical protein C0501_07110 [Isosphaera sp.]|nr:hypothetical protein [Isosphaera sp.]
MPQLTFPIAAAELLVDARVNLPAPDLSAVLAAGGPAPASVPVRGEIDTGSNATAVAPWVIRQLGLQPRVHTTTRGVTGSAQVRLFRVSLTILDASRPHLPWFVQPDLVVMELTTALPVDVLIGMDILLGCRLLVDGPALSFTLDF